MNYAVWNTLHDGLIESIDGAVPGNVHVRVNIPYLCEKLATAADYVNVSLQGCRRFEYQQFDGVAITGLSEIAASDVEVLSAEHSVDAISVACVNGFLKLSYDRTEISLAEGRIISQADLEAAADQYWVEWEERAKHAKD